MSDIAGFLLARIAEDEAVVRAEPRWLDPGSELLSQFGDFGDSERFMVEIGAARMLRECEAKRRIVAIHQDGNADLLAATRQWDPDTDLLSYCVRCEVEHDGERWPCETLRALALPYADHPDYRDEWKP